MNIIYQYYNEIALTFRDYETDFRKGTIVIYVPDDSKPLSAVAEKVKKQLDRIAAELDERDQNVLIRIERGEQSFEIRLEAEQ